MITQEGSKIIVELGEQTNGTLAAKRFKEIYPLLLALIQADDARDSLSETEWNARQDAVLATDLRFQVLLHETKKSAENLLEVTSGSVSAREIGFPEFDYRENKS